MRLCCGSQTDSCCATSNFGVRRAGFKVGLSVGEQEEGYIPRRSEPSTYPPDSGLEPAISDLQTSMSGKACEQTLCFRHMASDLVCVITM